MFSSRRLLSQTLRLRKVGLCAATGSAPWASSQSPVAAAGLRRSFMSNTRVRLAAALPLTRISSLTSLTASPDTVRIRARVQSIKVKSKFAFVVLREPGGNTLQAIVPKDVLSATARSLRESSGDATTAGDDSAAATAALCTVESVVDVVGALTPTPSPVRSASVTHLELQVTTMDVVSTAKSPLPFPLHDENTKLTTRLDFRSFDLRRRQNADVFSIASDIGGSFRRVLGDTLKLTEIHTPKLIGSPSEGGSSVFQLKYFERDAYLAQSPQLYKQMCVLGDLGDVFEIGSVFRAENSNTHRHMTEFMGVDVEMRVDDGHEDVLNVLEKTVKAVVEDIESKCAVPLARIRQELGASLTADGKPTGVIPGPLQFAVPDAVRQRLLSQPESNTYAVVVTPSGNVRITFDNAMRLLVDRGVLPAPMDDFSTVTEKALGNIVKEMFGVDVLLVEKYPLHIRAFYTMPLTTAPAVGGGSSILPSSDRSRSFDMLVRGEEICSGAQRIHQADLLEYRAKQCGVNPTLIRDYLEAFRYGAWPHGGFGIGLERFVMLLIGLPDIRHATLFPRDPTRLTP